MKRFFTILAFLASVIVAVPVVASAAQERLIAVIMTGPLQRYQDIHTVFEKKAPFCGEGCRIYVQKPHADTMSLRNSVRKAVALGADLIITYGPAATLAAQMETPRIPVLFADVYDPVKLKLVSEKNGYGRNMTGVRGDAPVQALLKYFLEATNADSLAILYDSSSVMGQLQKDTLEDSGRRRKIGVHSIAVKGGEDHLSVLAQLPSDIDGLFLANSEHPGSQLSEVIKYADNKKLPVITQRSGAAELGAFMVLESSVEEQGTQLAEMAGKLLSGSSTEDLPMYRPRDVAFIVNLKTAKNCGINVPFTTLSVASQVVR